MVDSSVSWLDFSEAERRRMIEIVALFKEQDTRDELGIASIRDSFSELFFPGTTTLQTRARYFLFIPWLYLSYEKRKVPSARIEAQLKYDEDLIRQGLIDSGETSAVIGMRSGINLQRYPSSIYWFGLQTWGINRFPGTQDQYQRSLNHWYQRQSLRIESEEREPGEGFSGNWDAEIPPAPKGFPYAVNFKLTRAEAEFLRERLAISCPNSLLTYLMENSQPMEPQPPYVWLHADYEIFPARLKNWLTHARNFAEAMQGAMLLYNLKLARLAHIERLCEIYEKGLKDWHRQISLRQVEWENWDRTEFWQLTRKDGRKVPYFTQIFVDEWLDMLFANRQIQHPEDTPAMGKIIEEREKSLKGSRSRIAHREHLEMWSGASLIGQFDFRWRLSGRIINDILIGLKEGK